MGPKRNQQKDLFERDRETQEIPVALRPKILRLMEDLLAEAIDHGRTEAQSRERQAREVGHEQDHA
ncbi:MAG: hypothetical protein ACYC5H_04940 [Methylovirgula sp.]